MSESKENHIYRGGRLTRKDKTTERDVAVSNKVSSTQYQEGGDDIVRTTHTPDSYSAKEIIEKWSLDVWANNTSLDEEDVDKLIKEIESNFISKEEYDKEIREASEMLNRKESYINHLKETFISRKKVEDAIQNIEIEDGGFDVVNAEESSIWAEGYESGQKDFKERILEELHKSLGLSEVKNGK